MVRITFDIPRNTHRYLVEPISGNSHLKVKLVKRFIKFVTSLSKCDKPHLRYLHDMQQNDFRSVYGRTCQNICKETGVENILDASSLDIKYEVVPTEEEYRVSMIKELMEIRSGRIESSLTKKEVQVMLDLLCSN